MKKNILMVCYYYPPLTDVGCKRSVAFSKYFKKYGWNPYVLSVKNPDKTYCSLGTDRPPADVPTEYAYSLVNLYKFFGKLNGLLSSFLQLFGIKIRRNYFYDIFCIPDIFAGWIPLAVFKGYKLIRKYNIDIIYVSCTPYSSAIIGILLKIITKKPLVIDFRDAIGLDIRSLKRFLPTRFRKRLDQRIVDNLLKLTDLFIVTTNELKEIYINQYPQVRDKIFAVHNGFDAKYLCEIDRGSKYPKFTIVYTGNFYFYAFDSGIFFEAIALLKKREKLNKNNFQFLFYGDGMDRVDQISQNHGVEDFVMARSKISYKDVLRVILKSHLQLLRIVKPMISTKLFEGIPLNTPFLAIIPTGEVEAIIKKYSPSSYIIAKESSDKVADAILDAMEKYRSNEIQNNHVQEFLDCFSRENLTLKLMGIIEQNLKYKGKSLEDY